jgi:serine/threonine-protein kinase
MQFVEGTSLAILQRAAADRGEHLPIGLVVRVMLETLEGLHAAHEMVDGRGTSLDLVHRDVSPQNILIGSDGVSRVTDFGVAKAAGRLATTDGDDIVKGKLRYLAPEQVGNNPLDRRVDVFAAGIVLWECLTGRALFEGDSQPHTLANVLAAAIAPLSSVRGEVRLALDEVCLRALERERSRRFPTARAFAEALEETAAGVAWKTKDVAAYVLELAREPIERGRHALRSNYDLSAEAEAALGRAGLEQEASPPPMAMSDGRPTGVPFPAALRAAAPTPPGTSATKKAVGAFVAVTAVGIGVAAAVAMSDSSATPAAPASSSSAAAPEATLAAGQSTATGAPALSVAPAPSVEGPALPEPAASTALPASRPATRWQPQPTAKPPSTPFQPTFIAPTATSKGSRP